MVEEATTLKYLNQRAAEYQPNPQLDKLIAALKTALEPVQLTQNGKFSAPRYPVALVVGVSRSGTTLISQLLAASGNFSYPTNFLARFAYAPWIGAMIQQMLFNKEYDFRGELHDIQSSIDFSSNLGKTSNALGISEFFHFWRKFFPNHEPGYLSRSQLLKVDINRMRQELASIEAVFDKPFVSKCKMMQYNISHFSRELPGTFFIHIKREPRYVMQSILRCRRRFYGRDDIWWAIKPKEFEWLSTLSPIYQIAGQVFFTDRGIEDQLKDVEHDRKLICSYEVLCNNPENLYQLLQDKFARIGCQLGNYSLDTSFYCDNHDKIDIGEIQELEKAYEDFQTGKVANTN